MVICDSETVLAEMGVALREDSTLVGVFSPRKVYFLYHIFFTSFSHFLLLLLQFAISFCGTLRIVGGELAAKL